MDMVGYGTGPFKITKKTSRKVTLKKQRSGTYVTDFKTIVLNILKENMNRWTYQENDM